MQFSPIWFPTSIEPWIPKVNRGGRIIFHRWFIKRGIENMWGVWGCARRSSLDNSTTVSIADGGGGVQSISLYCVCNWIWLMWLKDQPLIHVLWVLWEELCNPLPKDIHALSLRIFHRSKLNYRNVPKSCYQFSASRCNLALSHLQLL